MPAVIAAACGGGQKVLVRFGATDFSIEARRVRRGGRALAEIPRRRCLGVAAAGPPLATQARDQHFFRQPSAASWPTLNSRETANFSVLSAQKQHQHVLKPANSACWLNARLQLIASLVTVTLSPLPHRHPPLDNVTPFAARHTQLARRIRHHLCAFAFAWQTTATFNTTDILLARASSTQHRNATHLASDRISPVAIHRRAPWTTIRGSKRSAKVSLARVAPGFVSEPQHSLTSAQLHSQARTASYTRPRTSRQAPTAASSRSKRSVSRQKMRASPPQPFARSRYSRSSATTTS